jgi:hypothetical protein
MDVMDETRLAMRHYAARPGDFCMPDQPAPGRTGAASWQVGLTMAEARRLDRAVAEGARGNATVTFTSRRTSFDDALGTVMNRIPETVADADAARELLDRRVEHAQLRDVTTVRRQVAARDALHAEAERRVAEVDARDFASRVAVEVERRLRALEGTT